MNLDEIYTPIEEAKKEIQRRWEDKELEKSINDFLQGNIPKSFQDEPRAVYADHLATPNWFFFNFYEKSQLIGLKPIVLEHLEDIFITTNFTKASMAKMIFYHGKDHHDNMVTSYHKIIDLSGKNEKKKINELLTIWNENFVDFHHRAVNEFYEDIEFYNSSDWFFKFGVKAVDYYKYLLVLFLRNGVLFENYMLANRKEERFVNDIVIPAFKFIQEKFGVKPLIVPLIPRDEETNKYWWYYPESIKNLIDRKIIE